MNNESPGRTVMQSNAGFLNHDAWLKGIENVRNSWNKAERSQDASSAERKDARNGMNIAE
jgi:hypothetical protein